MGQLDFANAAAGVDRAEIEEAAHAIRVALRAQP
jgi:hypothetical protein